MGNIRRAKKRDHGGYGREPKIPRDYTDLNDRLKLFAHEYCSSLSQSEAYRRTHDCTGKTKSQIACNAARLYAMPKVRRYIESIFSERKMNLEISSARILQELAKIAFTNSADLIDIDTGRLKHSSEIEPDHLAALKGIAIDEFEDDRGSRSKSKIDLHDKLAALRLLAQVEGLTSDINQALKTLESYGIHLRKTDAGTWVVVNAENL